jgi:transposase
MNTPLLLNAPKYNSRDAARAVKQQAGLMIEAVSAGTLSSLLNLSGMIVTSYACEKQDKQEILHIFCEHKHDVAICPDCNTVTQAVHERTERCVRHLDIWGKRTYVHFAARRFDCEPCAKSFMEELSWLESQRRESMAYELHVYNQCRHSDIAAVAEQEGLHPETVRLIFGRWAKRTVQQQKRGRVHCLGIDELSLHKGHKDFVMVLSDLERHCVIAVLEERSQEALTGWLNDLSEGERKAIRVVTMDMWGPYRGVIKSTLPWAEIVADRFHVTKHLNDAITKIRCALQNKANPTDYELLKGTRWILVRHREELNPAEEAKLQSVLAAFPTLRKAYLLKERFRILSDKLKDRKQAERFLRAWVYEAQASGLSQLLKFVKTLENWWEEFLNYFNEGFTSAVVEGLNNAIRGIIRRAFGYHVFETFRLHVMVEQGNLPPPSPPI